MKKVIVAILMVACLLSAGCSDLQVKSEMGKAIEQNALVVPSRTATTQPAAALADNAKVFNAYYAGATVNLWPYLFGPKTILVNAKLYGDLQGMSLRADEYARQAATQPALSDAAMKQMLEWEAVWAVEVKNEKDGK